MTPTCPICPPAIAEAHCRRYLRGERSDHALDATALVNEGYLQLAGRWVLEEPHFVAIAAQLMGRIF